MKLVEQERLLLDVNCLPNALGGWYFVACPRGAEGGFTL